MGIYVAYVMYYVDYPRKRPFYVHLKETVYKRAQRPRYARTVEDTLRWHVWLEACTAS